MSEGNQRNAPASPTPPIDPAPAASKPAGATRPQPTVTRRTTPPGKPQFGSRPPVAKNPVRPQPNRTAPGPNGSGPNGSAPNGSTSNGSTPNGTTANGSSRPGPPAVKPVNRPPAAAQPRPEAPKPTAAPVSARPRMTAPEARTVSPDPRQRFPPPATTPVQPPASPAVAPAVAGAPTTQAAKLPAPVWSPPAPTAPRSWKDRLGLGKKTEPQAGLALAAPPAVPLTTADPGRTGTIPATPAAKVGTDRPASPETTQPDPSTAPQKKVLGVPVPALLRPGPTPKAAPTPVDAGGPRTEPLPAVVAAPAVQPAVHPEPASKPKAGTARRTRKARLRLSQVDPWSVMKTSFLFSIAAGIMLVVAVYAFWTVLSSTQLFDSINEIVQNVVSTPGDTTPFRVQEYVNTQKVMGVAALIACVDVLIFTALATLGSFLYNLAATMLGGLEVTLAED